MDSPISPITNSSTLQEVDIEKALSSDQNKKPISARCFLRIPLHIELLAPLQKLFNWRSSQTPQAENDDEYKRKIVVRKGKLRTVSNADASANTQQVEDRYRGYRSLSTFLDSDENFMIYRRFGYLHSRVLLRKQDQLRVLEEELDEYDDQDAEEAEQEGVSSRARKLLMSRDSDEAACRREDPANRTRTDILNDIEAGLKQYGWGTNYKCFFDCSDISQGKW